MRKLKDKNGYIFIKMPDHPNANNNGYVREHRIIVEKKLGRLLRDNEIVDHINGKTSDNRIENLRVCTHKENIRNCTLKAKNNKSGYRGVSFDKSRNKWQASIKVDYKSIGLGRFLNKEDAALAYNNFAKKYFGEFARLNII